MIPILFAKDAASFTNNGIGFLAECTSCTCTEERNGPYEMSMTYPVTGQLFDQLLEGAIIKAKANETSDPQLFRIYKVSKPLNGIVTCSAAHISYDLNGMPVQGLKVNNVTPSAAITQALTDTPMTHSFTAWSDVDSTNNVNIDEPISVRGLLAGHAGSILDVWGGGEYEFDNFVIKYHGKRGNDNDVRIEYGKNLTDIKQDSDISDTYTHVMPFAKYSVDNDGVSEDVYLYLPEKVIAIQGASLGHERCLILDLSDKFGEDVIPTESALRDFTNAYLNANDLVSPKVNITISFVQLWQTEEYKNIAVLERVSLCDIVTVRFTKYNIETQTKVIKTVFDSLLERYDSITLGDAKSSFADTINKQEKEIAEVKQSVKNTQAQTGAAIEAAIATATSLITGHSGGYVVLNPAEQPQEILIMDTPSMNTAVHVWRWNRNGLGYSRNGVGGPYEVAITSNGSIVADFITTGTMSANLIKGGTLQLGSNLNQNGLLQVFDEANNLIASLDKNGLKMYGTDGFYILINTTVGFAGYDRLNNKLFWVNEDEFHQRKAVVEEEITLCNKLRFIPIEITSGGITVNDGIGLVGVVGG